MWWIGGLGAAIALLGFQDDLRDLSVRVRFPVQIAIVATLVWIMSPLPPIAFSHWLVVDGYLLSILVVVAGVWWINLFNFMDGIDGIAASQSVVITLCAILIASWGSGAFSSSSISLLMLATMSACAGFLLRNWAPARVFMGDVGSNFLAFAIFSYALVTARDGSLSYAIWLMLAAAFATDATVTLVRRIRQGERPWEAHKGHAYQVQSRRWGHSNVTLLYSALTFFWCGGLALLAYCYPGSEWLVAAVCYLVLVPAAIAAGAGKAETPPAPP